MKTAWKEDLRKESWKHMERNTYNKTSTKSDTSRDEQHVNSLVDSEASRTSSNQACKQSNSSESLKRLESMFHLQPHCGMRQR